MIERKTSAAFSRGAIVCKLSADGKPAEYGCGVNTGEAWLFPLAVIKAGVYNDVVLRIPMADLFRVTAPLLIRLPTGDMHVLAECFPHARGLVYFDLFWHLGNPHKGVHVVEGILKGEGPWKIGDAVVRVLGCHGTDGALARRFDEWRAYLGENADVYPSRIEITAIARQHGAML